MSASVPLKCIRFPDNNLGLGVANLTYHKNHQWRFLKTDFWVPPSRDSVFSKGSWADSKYLGITEMMFCLSYGEGRGKNIRIWINEFGIIAESGLGMAEPHWMRQEASIHC